MVKFSHVRGASVSQAFLLTVAGQPKQRHEQEACVTNVV